MTSGGIRKIAWALVAAVVLLAVVAVVVPGAMMGAGVAAGYAAAVAMSAFVFGAPHHEEHADEPAAIEREVTLVP